MQLVFLFIVGASCTREEKPIEENELAFESPAHFPEPTYTFGNNPVTEAGFELGKKLFYEPALSRGGSVSCNSCHIQSTAFADSPIHPVSVGVDNRLGTRNAPALTNLAYYPAFFWDGGVTHLDFVPLNAIEAPFEMDESLGNVLRKLNNIEAYRNDFNAAFDIDSITMPYVLQALSQFTYMMVSSSSKYDDFRGGEHSLTQEELEGLSLFNAKCANCHSGELFTDFSFRNNGLDNQFADGGRAIITNLAQDSGKFRVPSLRNVGLTAPYMHDARFGTLEEVLNHYSDEVVESNTLDASLRTDEDLGIPLTQEEQQKIITFLHTLSDHEFVQDERFFNTP